MLNRDDGRLGGAPGNRVEPPCLNGLPGLFLSTEVDDCAMKGDGARDGVLPKSPVDGGGSSLADGNWNGGGSVYGLKEPKFWNGL
jgi:hypothetical protein